MNDTTMMKLRFFRLFVPILFLFLFSTFLPAQEESDPALEEALQDAEFIQFLKRSGQSLDGLQELKKPKPANNIVTNNAKTILETRNHLHIREMLENLQHCTTPGFKKRQFEFGNRIDMTPGQISRAPRDLDLAIEGDGFFCVCSNVNQENMEPQRFYTRYGSLERDTNGHLAVIYGTNIYPLEPKIAVPEDWNSLQISPQGEVWVTPNAADDSPAEKYKAGQIVIVRFSNSTRLHPENAILFSVTPLSGKPVSAPPGGARTGSIRQNALEQSNVSPGAAREEIERLIDVSKILKQLENVP